MRYLLCLLLVACGGRVAEPAQDAGPAYLDDVPLMGGVPGPGESDGGDDGP